MIWVNTPILQTICQVKISAVVERPVAQDFAEVLAGVLLDRHIPPGQTLGVGFGEVFEVVEGEHVVIFGTAETVEVDARYPLYRLPWPDGGGARSVGDDAEEDITVDSSEAEGSEYWLRGQGPVARESVLGVAGELDHALRLGAMDNAVPRPRSRERDLGAVLAGDIAVAEYEAVGGGHDGNGAGGMVANEELARLLGIGRRELRRVLRRPRAAGGGSFHCEGERRPPRPTKLGSGGARRAVEARKLASLAVPRAGGPHGNAVAGQEAVDTCRFGEICFGRHLYSFVLEDRQRCWVLALSDAAGWAASQHDANSHNHNHNHNTR